MSTDGRTLEACFVAIEHYDALGSTASDDLLA